MKKEEDLVTISEIIDYISQENEELVSYIKHGIDSYWYDLEPYKSMFVLVNTADEKLKLRVRRWLDFFYNKYADSILILEPTILVIFDQAVSSKFFYNQTNYEVSLSLKFYESYFKTKPNPLKYDYEMALFLFKTSLFYSKYYGFQQQPLTLAFDEINKDFSLDGMVKMFSCLFCKYKMPKALLKYVPKLENQEDILSQIISGKNLRKIKILPLQISKKEHFVFLNKIPDDIEFEDDYLKRLLVFAKILKFAPEQSELLEDLLAYSNTFKYRLSSFINDLSFWQDAFRFMLKVEYHNPYIGTREFVDFFEYHHYFSEQNAFIFKGCTVNSVLRLIAEWHGAADYQKDLELISKTWTKIEKSNFKTEYNNEQFIFKQIDNGKDLYKESEVLKHCVFSYIRDCIDGYTSIWSMQKIKDNTNERLLTIEIKDNEIVQVSGEYNRTVTSEEQILLNRFIEFNNLNVENYVPNPNPDFFDPSYFNR